MGTTLCTMDREGLQAALIEEAQDAEEASTLSPSQRQRGQPSLCCLTPCGEKDLHEELVHREKSGPRLEVRSPISGSACRTTARQGSDLDDGPAPYQRRGTAVVLARRGSMPGTGAKARGEPTQTSGVNWGFWRPVLMALVMAGTVYVSAFFQCWTGEVAGGPTLGSALNFGSIPVVAAVIGYGTNVAALVMMFYPLEFKGCFPRLRIGCGLDLPLCGWQGVIPMKARQMAEVSVDLLTQKLIKVEEIFGKLDPQRVAAELAGIMPDILPEVMDEAGRTHCPKLWEHIPLAVHRQLEERVAAQSGPMMAHFIEDLQRNINDAFDLKHCAVERLVADPQILNDIFLVCGAEEFDFIRSSGFYLGFLFGLLQMLVWLFCRRWWILPACGVFVGYYTNVIALKVIFQPVYPRSCLCGLCKLQGLFLRRQKQVSALYGEQVAQAVLTPDTLMAGLVSGPKEEAMARLVQKHVSRCMEDQTASYKPLFLLSNGAENWADFRDGVCDAFWQRMPRLLEVIKGYMWEAIDLEATLRTRLESLPPKDFERLLHAVFERDEIKLVLVGALLGAIVGMLQAVAQTPQQLGLPPLF